MTVTKKLALTVDEISEFNYKLDRSITKGISKFILKYNDFVMDERIYEPVRRLTKPLHKIWIGAWLINLKKSYEDYPFNKPGVYICVGEPGSGKSSLAMEIMTRLLAKTGKGSYINTAIEIPRVDDKTFRKYLHHPRYEITDFFDKGEIVAYPNHFQFASMHIDEAHMLWNYRQNQSDDYMKTFKPFMKYAVGVRHYIKYIFLYTQMEKVDTQVMSLGNKNFFEVQVRKGFNYDLWLVNGRFETTILGWDLIFFNMQSNGSGGWIKHPYKQYFLPRTFDLQYFDTYNLRSGLGSVTFDNRFKTEVVKR
ncbi:Zonular occludens toxin (Zot) [Acholeplasma oculi]|uniref:Phage protein L2_04 of Acholplasma phage L2, Zona occludens toxin n=1 Tax=Acholeplasma oculi TaxID=35623 RepID=A0A061AJ75_9MOLU|nr:ATP-binding protein [Acholeplasma oculi]CDR31042.1 Phage protein L2_04 of Acholplasma phage L2, Zona occludens toxin [Acholeplasma oculi]SKC36614.1 ATPase family associated with various cellular activities (AAA) [Acholeplasma oculi]SUT90593.1 Zonular occludens toxin (Zot) [Acholeplasma oculi]